MNVLLFKEKYALAVPKTAYFSSSEYAKESLEDHAESELTLLCDRKCNRSGREFQDKGNDNVLRFQR
jgi:hypothetical protein